MNESTTVKIRKINHAFLKIECNSDIAMELSEAFKFLVDGYKFMPAYRMGRFDGYIRMFNLGTRQIASGLFAKVVEFCKSHDYPYEVIDDFDETGYESPNYQTSNINKDSMLAYMQSLNLTTKGVSIQIRDYQVEGVTVMIRDRQAIIKSSVGSGKSCMLYCASRYITEVLGFRVLILVPTIGLTTQMQGDFADYASSTDWKVSDNIHLISAGADHTIKKPITISTFQSLKNNSSEWFNEFGAIIADEGHSITAKSFQDIYGKATRVPFRIACTGTLHAAKCHTLTMQGLTGPIYSIAETKDLIAVGQLVPMRVKAISLKYQKDLCKLLSKVTYEEEIKWITSNPKRNKFIKNLAVNCSGTTLVFFRFVEHGKAMFDLIKEAVGESRSVFFIDGDVSKEEREDIRLVANSIDAIIVASYGTMKMGINLPAVENIILGHPTKGGITFGQSIGRGLRLKTGKTHCNLFDISDCLSHGKKINHTWKHFGDRMLALTREGYDFSIVDVEF